RLALLGGQLLVCSPCALGSVFQIRAGDQPFPGMRHWSADSNVALSLQPIEGQVLNHDASGFCALQDAKDRWRLIYWDPGRRSLVALDTSNGATSPLTMTDYQ